MNQSNSEIKIEECKYPCTGRFKSLQSNSSQPRMHLRTTTITYWEALGGERKKIPSRLWENISRYHIKGPNPPFLCRNLIVQDWHDISTALKKTECQWRIQLPANLCVRN
jgi:hypothetical protein